MTREEAARLVHEAVWLDDSGYLTVHAVTGIDVGRLQALRNGDAGITEPEAAALRAFTAERSPR